MGQDQLGLLCTSPFSTDRYFLYSKRCCDKERTKCTRFTPDPQGSIQIIEDQLGPLPPPFPPPLPPPPPPIVPVDLQRGNVRITVFG